LVPAKGRWCSAAGEVTAGLAESNGSPTAGWMTYTVTCRLTACTPGSAPGPTLGIEYGKRLPFTVTSSQLCSTRRRRNFARGGGVHVGVRHTDSWRWSVFCHWWPWPLTFDLDIQTRPIEGLNMSSLWIWRKSDQRFPRYFIHKQKSHRQRQGQNLTQFTACDNQDICIAVCWINSSLRRLGMARVNEGSHSFTCHPHVHPKTEWAMSAVQLERFAPYFWRKVILLRINLTVHCCTRNRQQIQKCTLCFAWFFSRLRLLKAKFHYAS